MNGELPNKPLFSEHLASKGIFFYNYAARRDRI